jgi:hypothetical protein
MDYFGRIEQELRAATRRRGAAAPRRARLRGLRPALIAFAVLLTAATALAASGVIPLGSAVKLPRRPNPSVGSGVPARGGSRLLPLRAADPGGGPPWGVRVVRTTRGLLCLQIGRVQDGRLGELGIDGAFHDDGRFHPLPADDLPDSLLGLGVGFSEVGENATCHLPDEAFSGDRIGVERSAAGPANTTHEPRAQLRDLYFGSLGPQALGVSYREGASVRTAPVVAGLGVYLIVLPTHPREQLATGGGSMGSAGGLSPVAPLTAIAYRLRGVVCERVTGGRAAHPCPPPQSLYGPASRHAKVRALHVPLLVKLRTTDGILVSARVSFRAPLAVTGAAQSYQLRLPLGRCDVSGPGRGYVSTSTERDIAAGSLVSQTIAYPFANSCGRRANLEVLYMANGSPPVPVGTATIVQPPGTRAARPHEFAGRLRRRRRG